MSAPTSSAPKPANGAAPAAQNADKDAKPVPQLGALEEDDEFEEFEAEDWNESEEDQLDVHQWEDNWDDDDIEDDFSQQLR
ncbi:26S proteasome complex subunit SEM1 [Dimargaris verticillata]|uniref:26S proteasome complex subunit SEM1 n=1 Tax=Dimargaris verticillata TaxID=2761393 RepID=A0A9W8AXF9_9FUNG|nr:26S proteasome complex subunit SEM1 [Dimargaris verticillata]